MGSVPLALLLARAAKGVDIRRHGSGNIGATNVLRVVGLWAAAAVLMYDVAKGVVPVVVARLIADSPAVDAMAAGAAVAGHVWPVWLRFKGGKGVATALGAVGALAPIAGAASLVVGVTAIAGTRFVSLGSVLGTLAAMVATITLYSTGHLPLAYLVLVMVVAPLIVGRHWSNLARLRNGTESRLGQRVTIARAGPGGGGS